MQSWGGSCSCSGFHVLRWDVPTRRSSVSWKSIRRRHRNLWINEKYATYTGCSHRNMQLIGCSNRKFKGMSSHMWTCTWIKNIKQKKRKHIQDSLNFSISFTDLGGHEIGDATARSAKAEVLVFMAVAINSSWRIPLGYFFVAGLSAKGKHY